MSHQKKEQDVLRRRRNMLDFRNQIARNEQEPVLVPAGPAILARTRRLVREARERTAVFTGE